MFLLTHNCLPFLSIIFTVLLLCNHVSYAQDKTDPTDTATPAIVANEGDKITPSKPEQNQERTEDKDSTRDISVEDLAVQERMADAAEEATKLTNTQNIIGWIGLGLVTITAWFAWGAWQAGKDAANVGREIGIAQTRAYLKVTDFSIRSSQETVSPSNYHLIFRFKLENTGSTPASNIKAEVAHMLYDPVPVNSFESAVKKIKSDFDKYRQAPAVKIGSIASRSFTETGTGHGRAIIIGNEVVENPVDRLCAVAVVRVNYTDVFANETKASTPNRVCEVAGSFVWWVSEERNKDGRSHPSEEHTFST